MIRVRKINQQEILVNCELIETIEFSPHAVISLSSGQKIIVADGLESILGKVLEYRRLVNSRPLEIRAGQASIDAI
jgi:flagellar protein FlbD